MKKPLPFLPAEERGEPRRAGRSKEEKGEPYHVPAYKGPRKPPAKKKAAKKKPY